MAKKRIRAAISGSLKNNTPRKNAATGEGRAVVSPHLLEGGSGSITAVPPPLVDLNQQQFDSIARSIDGGRENIQDIYPTTPLQEGMLIDCLLNERSDTYTFSTLFECNSKLHLDRWITAVNAVVARHEVMRSAIVWEEVPRPLQVIQRRATFPVFEIALESGHDPVEQLRERMTPGKQRVIDLRQAPLGQLLIAADPDNPRWFVLLQLHHLISDLHSLKVFISEAMAYFECRERDPPLAEGYRQYVATRLAHAPGDEADARVFFGAKLRQVNDSTAPFGLLDVHGDASRIEQTTENIDPALARQIRAQAARIGVTPARILHAAWAIVVSRTSGREDVVFGTVLSTIRRGSPEAQQLP